MLWFSRLKYVFPWYCVLLLPCHTSVSKVDALAKLNRIFSNALTEKSVYFFPTQNWSCPTWHGWVCLFLGVGGGEGRFAKYTKNPCRLYLSLYLRTKPYHWVSSTTILENILELEEWANSAGIVKQPRNRVVVLARQATQPIAELVPWNWFLGSLKV